MKKCKMLLIILLCILLVFSFSGCSHEHDWYYSSSKSSSNHTVYACYDCEETFIDTLPPEEDDLVDCEYSEDTLEYDNSSNNVTVYITNSGAKYHSSGCQYLSSSKYSVSLEEAISDGYTPCSRCNPPIE